MRYGTVLRKIVPCIPSVGVKSQKKRDSIVLRKSSGWLPVSGLKTPKKLGVLQKIAMRMDISPFLENFRKSALFLGRYLQ